MTADLSVVARRALALKATREFFWARGYREIDTPLLARSLIPEATIEVFVTESRDQCGVATTLFLIPSPELHMKRLLAYGGGNLFQLVKCFRNGEPPTGIHHPEFTMLEWYTVDAGYLDSLVLEEEFIDFLRRTLGVASTVTRRGNRIDLTPPFLRITMRDAFAEYAGLDLDRILDARMLGETAAALGLPVTPDDDGETLFHKIFLQSVEPHLPAHRPFFLLDYPAVVPTLAETDEHGRYARRWELFIGGLEIANCYTEERDRERIERFFKEEGEKKRSARMPTPADMELARIIADGLPPCSGNAVGFDRLLMILLEKETIQEVIPFAWRDG